MRDEEHSSDPRRRFMHTVLRLIELVDISVYSWLSRLHGDWFLDRLAYHLESNLLFKGGLFVSMYWYFWFREERDQQERRNTIPPIFVGTLVGLFITRMVATLAPFRVRPMYDLNLQHHPLSIPILSDFVNWSSFPSDHAAFLGALGFGLIRFSRPLTIPIVLYLAVGICLPRMYLGIHYASDILVGAGIGVAALWAVLKIEGIRSIVARPLLAFMEAKPQVFYAAAFLVSFEMAAMFWDIREPVRAVLHAASTVPHHIALGVGLVLFGSLVAIGIAVRHRF
jgi:membrane-associated phospholipid phosphatase